MMTIARPARAAVMSWERIGRLASSVAAANAREKAPFRSDDRLMSGIASSPCLGERNRTALISPLFSSLFLSIEPKLSHRKLRSEEHTSELQSLMRISYAFFCLKKKKTDQTNSIHNKTY